MRPENCTLVLVTKGGSDLEPILATAKRGPNAFGKIIIWDNATRLRWNGCIVGPGGPVLGMFDHASINCPDVKVYGRYMQAIHFTRRGDVICFCDDDTIVDWPALIARYQPGKLVCNMPQKWCPHYQTTGGICLVGFGAIFHRALLDDAFGPYDRSGFPRDEIFLRECDRVFTYQHRDKQVWVDVPITQLPCSWGTDRMYRQARTGDDYKEIRRRLALIK